MLAAFADTELLGANIITGSVAVQHNAQAQHQDHQAREPLSKSCCCCCCGAVQDNAQDLRTPSTGGRRRRGRPTDRHRRPPGPPFATVRRIVCTCRVFKIMLKIGGRGKRRSSRRSARVFDSRAHTTHRRQAQRHNHIQPAQPSQTEPDATPERGETIVLDHFIRLAFKKRASLRSQQSWAGATPSASTSRPAHGSRSKGPL